MKNFFLIFIAIVLIGIACIIDHGTINFMVAMLVVVPITTALICLAAPASFFTRKLF